jgi:deazaflavin-dependent oxidoreductase (nitroreductase family)
MAFNFNQSVIDEFRANEGRVGGPFEGGRLILLTTTGARSGASHTVPLGYFPDGGSQILIIGSAAGADRHPAWFHNLVANPLVTVENGVFTYEARASVLTGTARDLAFARAVEMDPGWADYQAKTSRTIPVVAVESVASGPPNMNAASPGAALKLIHDAFRRELALIRKEFASAGPSLGAQLRINCLTMCQGLRNHHTGEDMGMFPHLARKSPELAAVIDKLRDEHLKLAALVSALQEAVSGGSGAAEVDLLIDELENHLLYEESVLIPVLDSTAVG